METCLQKLTSAKSYMVNAKLIFQCSAVSICNNAEVSETGRGLVRLQKVGKVLSHPLDPVQGPPSSEELGQTCEFCLLGACVNRPL